MQYHSPGVCDCMGIQDSPWKLRRLQYDYINAFSSKHGRSVAPARATADNKDLGVLERTS